MPYLYSYDSDTMTFVYSRHQPAPPEWFPLHVHEQMELLYFVKGDANCLIESTVYPMTPHTLLITRPMEAHKMNILSSGMYERYVLNVDPQLVRNFDPTGRLLRPFYNRALGQGNAYMANEFDVLKPLDLFRAMCRDGLTTEQHRVILLTYLYPLLEQLVEVFDSRKDQPAPQPTEPGYPIVQYINRHLFEDLSLEHLCQEFHISRAQLGRLFKQSTGASVWRYILHKRMLAARRQILNGQPAAFTCVTCGFQDYSAFYRAYRKIFGCSPQQDAKRHKIES